MKFKVLLYPQTLFYPLRVLKADPWVETYGILSLIETEKRIKTLFPELYPRCKFLTLKEPPERDLLTRVLEEIKSLGLYLRTPESLKLFKLHQDLFEEGLPAFKAHKPLLSALERAILVLALAEEIDQTLLEVALSLQNFSQTWERLFEEKILFKDPFLEENLLKKASPEDKEGDELWELTKRLKSLKTIFPQVNFEGLEIQALLITEEEILEDLKETFQVSKEETLGEGIFLFEFASPLIEGLSLPTEENLAYLQKVLFVSE